MIAPLLWSVLLASSPSSDEAHAKRFVLEPNRRIYSVGLTYETSTSLWTDMACAAPSIGDPERFGVSHRSLKPADKRFSIDRFILTPLVDKPGSFTTYTFECEQGVRFVIEATQVEREQAAFLVEVTTDSATQNRIQTAREELRQELEQSFGQRLETQNAEAREQAEQSLLKRLLQTYAANDDIEQGRKNFVRLKSTGQLSIGERTYVLFELKNVSGRSAMLKAMHVDAQDHGPLLELKVETQSKHLPHAESVRGVVSFMRPPGVREITLVAELDRGDRIEVDDLELM